MNRQIIIRADVGPQVGTGHVMRTAALAMAYNRLGGHATLLCDMGLPETLKRRFERNGVSVATMKPATKIDDAIQTRQMAEDLEADWIVVDGYEFDDEYQQVLKLSLAQLMVIDDFGHATHRLADLILNQNIYSDVDDYELEPEKVVCGSDFVLLRSEFADVSHSLRTPKKAKRILLTFGGADEKNFTGKCLEAMTSIDNSEDYLVDVIVGACNPHQIQLKQLIKQLPFNAMLHRNVDRMSAILAQSELAVTAGGSTCYELARCGVPSIVVSMAENQRAVAESFSNRECMIWLGDAEQVGKDLLANEINKLACNSKRRSKLIENSTRIVDGRGADRIARRLHATQLYFREARLDDAKLLMEWRNEKATRAASFHPDTVEWQEHQTWFRRTLNNNLIDLWIVEIDDVAIGQVRFEFDSIGDQAAISISLAPEFRNRGLGTTVIETACRKTFLNDDIESIAAFIKPDNSASLLAFQKAGFADLNPISVHGNVAKQLVLQRDKIFPRRYSSKSSPTMRKSA